MTTDTLLLYCLTIVPLICTPGPDILFVVSQGLTGRRVGALRALAGVLLGYSAHAALSAFGLAALVAASPVLFDLLKWAGVGYLAFLAVQMLRSAARPGSVVARAGPIGRVPLWKGFLTSFLNPKGLLMFFALLPQFMTPGGSAVIEAATLSAVFIAGCALVYGALGLAAARAGSGTVADRTRRQLEGAAGALLTVAAVRLATQQ